MPSQRCLLLASASGVVCNVMFLDWLVTALLTMFLVFTMFKTYRTRIKRWRAETAVMGRT
jgi:hypothetical protein